MGKMSKTRGKSLRLPESGVGLQNAKLLDACLTGNAKGVLAAIASGANINHRHDDDFTALNKAVEMYRYEMVKLLLRNGGDPSIRDQKGRSAWYHAFFSPVASNEDKQHQMLDLLLGHAGGAPAEAVIMSTQFIDNRPNIVLKVLNTFYFEVATRLTGTQCEYHVLGLENLDHPLTTVPLPDGSRISPGVTPFHSLIETSQGRVEIITHPVIKALLQWKLLQLRKYLWVEITLYVALMVLANISVLYGFPELHPEGGSQQYETTTASWMPVCNWLTVALLVFFFVLTLFFDLSAHRLRVKKEAGADEEGGNCLSSRAPSRMSLFIGLLLALSVTLPLGSEMAIGGETKKSLQALFILLMWLWSFQYMKLQSSIGHLFIAYEVALKKDIGPIALMVLTILPGLTLGLRLTASPKPVEFPYPREKPLDLAGWAFFLTLSVSDQQHNLGYYGDSTLFQLLYLCFVLLIPLSCLVLSIATMSNTIEEAVKRSKAVRLLNLAEYVKSREDLLTYPYFGFRVRRSDLLPSPFAIFSRNSTVQLSVQDVAPIPEVVTSGFRFIGLSSDYLPLRFLLDKSIEEMLRIERLQVLTLYFGHLTETVKQLTAAKTEQTKRCLEWTKEMTEGYDEIIQYVEAITSCRDTDAETNKSEASSTTFRPGA